MPIDLQLGYFVHTQVVASALRISVDHVVMVLCVAEVHPFIPLHGQVDSEYPHHQAEQGKDTSNGCILLIAEGGTVDNSVPTMGKQPKFPY